MRFITLLALTLLLNGCENVLFGQKSISQICKQYPQMCRDLNTDAHCRLQKAEIIRARYENLKQPSDHLKYKLLMQFEDYNYNAI